MFEKELLGKPHISILSTRNVICSFGGGGGAAVTFHGKIRSFFSKALTFRNHLCKIYYSRPTFNGSICEASLTQSCSYPVIIYKGFQKQLRFSTPCYKQLLNQPITLLVLDVL